MQDLGNDQTKSNLENRKRKH